jgi:Glyceraldehyde 3-phosphate dehydrogenase, C-terminal domain
MEGTGVNLARAKLHPCFDGVIAKVVVSANEGRRQASAQYCCGLQQGMRVGFTLCYLAAQECCVPQLVMLLTAWHRPCLPAASCCMMGAPLKPARQVQGQHDASKDHIVTAASCTTNCLAPVVKVIHEKLGIAKGSITTIHCVTNTQTRIDAPSAKKADLRRARSVLTSLAPTSTGSATAIALIFPDLKGKLNGVPSTMPNCHRHVSCQ